MAYHLGCGDFLFLIFPWFLELLSEHDVAEGLDEYLGVKPPGAVFQVVEVEFQSSQHLRHGICIAVVECGVGGDTRTNLVEVLVARVVLHDLVDVELALGTRTDERHVADEDIPELRKLVEVVRSQEGTHLGEARVTAHLQEVGAILLGINAHGAKLIDEERLAMKPDALLSVNDWKPILPADGDGASQGQGREYQKAA